MMIDMWVMIDRQIQILSATPATQQEPQVFSPDPGYRVMSAWRSHHFAAVGFGGERESWPLQASACGYVRPTRSVASGDAMPMLLSTIGFGA